MGGGAEGRGWLKEYFFSCFSLSSPVVWSDDKLLERQLFQLSLELVEVDGLNLVGLRLDDLVEIVNWSSSRLETCFGDIKSSVCVFCCVSVMLRGASPTFMLSRGKG